VCSVVLCDGLSILCLYFPCRYGLLGASGCGKTTLLRCVLGRLPIQSGHILILGKPPGTRGHNIPGKGVGYMPQVSWYHYKLMCSINDITGRSSGIKAHYEGVDVLFWNYL